MIQWKFVKTNDNLVFSSQWLVLLAFCVIVINSDLWTTNFIDVMLRVDCKVMMVPANEIGSQVQIYRKVNFSYMYWTTWYLWTLIDS